MVSTCTSDFFAVTTPCHIAHAVSDVAAIVLLPCSPVEVVVKVVCSSLVVFVYWCEAPMAIGCALFTEGA